MYMSEENWNFKEFKEEWIELNQEKLLFSQNPVIQETETAGKQRVESLVEEVSVEQQAPQQVGS